MGLKTCKDCPSYLTDPEEQRSRFGKAIAAPMCARFGHVLGRPGLDNEQVAIRFASDCPSYNGVVPSKPVSISNSRILSPDLTVLAGGETDTPCSTCSACSNMVMSVGVQGNFGWPVNACRAKGTVIFKTQSSAAGCTWAKPGAPTVDTTGLEVLPHYGPRFKVSDDIVMADLLPDLGGDPVEPSTAETEAPVSDSDKGTIRAWFKVVNPSNGREYFLPRFEPGFFTEEERALIPQTGDDEHPELYVDHANLMLTFAVDSYSLDDTVCLIGEPGNGKTEFGRYLAYQMQAPFTRLSLTEYTDPEDFLGGKEFDPVKGTYLKPGRLPRAWGRPGVLVSDEFNVAPDAIMQVYRPLTDNSRQLVIEDVMFDRNPYCFHLMTMNPSWDSRNIGTKPMADADGNRLSFVWVPEPSAPVLRHILRERCAADGYDVSDETLRLISAIGADLREASEQHAFPGSWGIRQEVKVARKTAHYDLPTAYRRAVLDSLDPKIAQLVLSMIESHIDPDADSASGDRDPF